MATTTDSAQKSLSAASSSYDSTFNEFYSEVKQIEVRDSVLTSKQQIDRLTRPGATYFNLNPFDVLQVDPDTPLPEIKQKFKRMSILVHPDKNLEDNERAQKSFDAVKKSWLTLENDEGYRKCKEVVTEAKERVEEGMKLKRKQLKKEGKSTRLPEDDSDKYRHSVYVQTCKLFADLERLRQEQEAKDMHERKRKAEEQEEEVIIKKEQAEWNKNFEESRTDRVTSWRDFQKQAPKGAKKVKKVKGGFRPPKPRPEQRD
ncbi:hypothetical protein CAPTEDRAFT_180570 [Capitella teleta]|uniref:J domain-containing protein n=1 Tax=Capitella teleta TaxID=283909 RepID=R7VG14_CAPTE|nr:hypothetical protein CAPTEDRAFT_180570 [Capitella teleta]|eukprot:ELU14620.1 hypothetical protein CAPTEDRAFT_180570 [Capitella teleta]